MAGYGAVASSVVALAAAPALFQGTGAGRSVSPIKPMVLERCALGGGLRPAGATTIAGDVAPHVANIATCLSISADTTPPVGMTMDAPQRGSGKGAARVGDASMGKTPTIDRRGRAGGATAQASAEISSPMGSAISAPARARDEASRSAGQLLALGGGVHAGALTPGRAVVVGAHERTTEHAPEHAPEHALAHGPERLTEYVTQPVAVISGNGVNGHASPAPGLSFRTTDGAAPSDVLQVRFDQFEATPRLNVELLTEAGAAAPGQDVEFQGYWNYSHWIERAEIWVVDRANAASQSPIAVIPVDVQARRASWSIPASTVGADYAFMLRVYDKRGAHDQTRLKPITIVDGDPIEALTGSRVYGEDATEMRNIAVDGAAVTVFVPASDGDEIQDVELFGRAVSRQENGGYVVREILPAGEHPVHLSFTQGEGDQVTVDRIVTAPANDLFFVALGDLTVGQGSSDGASPLSADGQGGDDTFTRGRGAFYLKGVFAGEYRLTAALDTTEDDLDNLLSNLGDKSPQSLLRRIDPNRFYQTYGDDSTIVEDAPTQGRFYVRLEDDNSYLLWGDFFTDIQSTTIAPLDRGLYGAKALIRSDALAANGDRRFTAVGFAADPGTIPAREDFLATGGSVYFLERQDITLGSERIRLEIRDQDTGFVREVVRLRPHVDYTVDYIRGRVLLNRPVSAIRARSTVVREGPQSGDTVHLVVRYEYTPGLADIDGFTLGGRTEVWLTEAARVGVSGQREETADADQTLTAVDLLVRRSDDTYAKLELARSQGAAFTERRSDDGGFTFDTVGANLAADEAFAARLEGGVALQDVLGDGADGRISGYYERSEQGYAGAGRIAETDVERMGLTLAKAVSDAGEIKTQISRVEQTGRREELTATLDYAQALFGAWRAKFGLRYSDVENLANAVSGSGERVDLGVELGYQITQSARVYAFGQGTVANDGARQDNNRTGVGLDAQITERVSARGEISDGDGGLGAALGVTYRISEAEEYYLNYALDQRRPANAVTNGAFGADGQNTITAGGRKRFNDVVSVYGEERANFGDASGLTHAFGVELAPLTNWTFGAAFEVGEIEIDDRVIEREGYSASAGYSTEDVTLSSAFEWVEDTNNGAMRQTWLFRSNLGYQVNPDWRALARFNKAESNASSGDFFDGDFTEFQMAGAYRPTDNNRLNALVRYTYFEDLPSAAQVSNSGQTGLPAQKSNVFSVDGNYRVLDWLTVGGKYGYRQGEVSLSRADADFVDSTANLAVIRADVHVVKRWDALAEWRQLRVNTAQDVRAGGLVAVYRHFGDNAKVGVGYNFTDFSDNLTDLSYDDDGAFLNVIAKF